jgi:hypothetical protein
MTESDGVYRRHSRLRALVVVIESCCKDCVCVLESDCARSPFPVGLDSTYRLSEVVCHHLCHSHDRNRVEAVVYVV